MAFDAHKNFAYSTVATAPSPPTSGASLTVAAGEGARLPAAPFNATVWPAGAQASPSNAEIVRVTGIAGDVLTIVRAQEGTTARAIVVGDQIQAGITVKTLTDAESAAGGDYLRTGTYSLGLPHFAATGQALSSGDLWLRPFLLTARRTFDRIGVNVSGAGTAGAVLRLGVYALPTSAPTLDAGTIGSTTTGAKEIATSFTLDPGLWWLACAAQVAGCSVYGTNTSNMWVMDSGLGAATYGAYRAATGVSGALPSAPGYGPGPFSTCPLVGLRAA